MATTNVTIRMDTELKKQAEELFGELGMSMTTAFNVFVRQAVREQQIPFMISREIPNAETLAAIQEADDIRAGKKSAKSYHSAAELFEDIDNEV